MNTFDIANGKNINVNGLLAGAANGSHADSRNGQHLLVKDWMTSQVFAIETGIPVADAYNLMMQKNIRRLPVVEGDRMVGIVTLGDLREARPSPASSLSIYELNYLLAKLTVGQVMTHNPFTVMPDTPIL